jgi:hypothetical protein
MSSYFRTVKEKRFQQPTEISKSGRSFDTAVKIIAAG